MQYWLLVISFLFLPFLKADVSATKVAASTADKNELLWAADPKGGVPYVFQEPQDMDILTGFEKEIIEEVARLIDKKPVFVANTWEFLIPGLERRQYDVIINGLEITESRMEAVNFSVPYYKSYLQLVVAKDNNTLKTLQDCRGKAVGILRNSKAVDPLYKLGDVDVRTYSDEVNGFIDVANHRIDAFLIDYPVALYYVGPNPDLKLIGEPVGTTDYGIVLRKEDSQLLAQINAAIGKMIRSGKLREILDRWNLWNDLMKTYTQDFSANTNPPTAYEAYIESFTNSGGSFKKVFKKYLGFLPSLLKGAVVTVEISVVSMMLAMFLGLVLAVVRIYGPKPLSILSNLYVECIRGTPLLIQLYFIYYGLPTIGIKLPPFISGVVTLGFNYAAFEAENYRAGIVAIHSGQMEAARALGMTQWQGLRHVVIPQAFRIMLPPVTNDFIALLKDSALVSVVSIVDLTHAYNLIATNHFNYFQLGILVAFIYLMLGLPFIQLTRWAERRLAVEKKRNY